MKLVRNNHRKVVNHPVVWNTNIEGGWNHCIELTDNDDKFSNVFEEETSSNYQSTTKFLTF